MSGPGEYETVQARILKYAQEIGWTYVPRAEAERRRGFDSDGATAEDRARKRSLFFGDLLHGFMVARLRVHALALPELKRSLRRMHDEKRTRIPNAPLSSRPRAGNYFEELLARIRDIRSPEKGIGFPAVALPDAGWPDAAWRWQLVRITYRFLRRVS